MNEKDYAKLVKEYEKLHAAEPEEYIMDMNEEFEGLLEFVDDEFRSFSMEKQIEIMIKWIDMESTRQFKYYTAFKNRSMEMLDNVIYESALEEHVNCILSPGNDHAYFVFNVLPEILAANLPERVERIVPLENGAANNGFQACACIINLFMAIWYRDEELKAIAMAEAEKWLSKKITLQEKAYIDCYLGFLNKDPQAINSGLIEICQGGRKDRDINANAFTKGFCIPAHAVYNLAHWAYGGELEKDIVMPDEANFCQDLAKYQKERGFKHGERFTVYPEELKMYDAILTAEPPVMHLGEPYRKKKMLDNERFAKELYADILKK